MKHLVCRLLRRYAACACAALFLSVPAPSGAMTGGALPSAEGVGRSVVVIVGSRGTFCTGAALTRTLVLTAAHCVQAGTQYKIVIYRSGQQPALIDVARAETHPRFSLQNLIGHRATADVALMTLTAPLPPEKTVATLGTPTIPIQVGTRLTVAGAGVMTRGDGRSGGTVRAASLAITGRPGTLQIRLVDPLTGGIREGLGACTGDSGAPVFEDQNGRAVVVGVVSWSTGPNLSEGCGGLTGVTPLTLYRDWIIKAARDMGAQLAP